MPRHVENTILNVLSRWNENLGRFESNQVTTTGQPLDALQRLGLDSKEESLKPSLRRAFYRLEDNGIVKRIEPPGDNDGRKVWWELTAKGLEKAAKISNSYSEDFDRIRRRYGGTWPQVS